MSLLRDELLRIAGWRGRRRERLPCARASPDRVTRGAGTSGDGRRRMPIRTRRHWIFSPRNCRLAQDQLNSITGEFSSDDLLGVIFSRFCIGKNEAEVECTYRGTGNR